MARRNQDETSMTPPPPSPATPTLAEQLQAKAIRFPATTYVVTNYFRHLPDGTYYVCEWEQHQQTVDAFRAEVASLQSRLAEAEGLRGALQTVESDIDYALRRANTNGDGSMDHLSATRLIKALATIKAALAGERK